MFKTPLFIRPSRDIDIFDTMTKTAVHKLRMSINSNWEQEVIKHIYATIPYITKYPFSVEIDQRSDRKAGLGIGDIIVKGTVNIPLIFSPKNDQVELAPLDVFRMNGKSYPLSKKRIDEIFYSPDMGSVATPREMVNANISDRMNSTNPPGYEGMTARHTKLGSMNKTMLDEVLDYADDSSLNKVASFFSDDSKMLRMAYNKTAACIKKVVTRKVKPKQKKKKTGPRLKYSEITKLSNGHYKVASYRVGVDEPEINELSQYDIRRTFGDECIIKVANKGYNVVQHVPVFSNLYEKTNDGDLYEPIEKVGSYTVCANDGYRMTGRVLKEVGFDGELTGNYLFTNGEKYASSNKMVGIETLVDTDYCLEKTASQNNVAKTFVMDGVISTPPLIFENGTIKTASGYRMFVKPNKYGISAVETTSDIKGIQKLGSVAYISDRMNLVELGERTEIVKYASFAKKRETLVNRDKLVKVAKHNGKYKVTYEGTSEIMGYPEAASFFMKIGGSINDTKEILNSASNGSINIGVKSRKSSKTPESPKVSIPKESKQPKMIGVKTAEFINKMKNNFDYIMKIAMIAPDEKSVDAMLGLGLVNDQSVAKFRDYIPQMEETLSSLASMLIAVRYGTRDISENSIKGAIDFMEKVIEDVKGMFAVQDASARMDY